MWQINIYIDSNMLMWLIIWCKLKSKLISIRTSHLSCSVAKSGKNGGQARFVIANELIDLDLLNAKLIVYSLHWVDLILLQCFFVMESVYFKFFLHSFKLKQQSDIVKLLLVAQAFLRLLQFVSESSDF